MQISARNISPQPTGVRVARTLSLVRVPASPVPSAAGASAGGQHTIPVACAVSLLAGTERVDADALLANLGVSPAMLESPLARLQLDSFAKLVRHVVRRGRDEMFGLCTRPVKSGTFALAARQMVRSATLGDALRAGMAVYSGAIDDFALRLRVHDGEASVLLIDRRAADGPGATARSVFLFCTLAFASWLVQRRIRASRVTLSTETSGRLGPDGPMFFGTPIQYGQPCSSLTFDAGWLNLPVVPDVASLQTHLGDLPGCLFVLYRPSTSLVADVRHRLRPHLGGELPSLVELARAMNLAPQWLRRRLYDQGSGYQEIKKALLRDAAIEYLTRSDLNLADIAEQLCFAEPSAFQRAFKRWTGVAPGEYRRTHCGRPSEAAANGCVEH